MKDESHSPHTWCYTVPRSEKDGQLVRINSSDAFYLDRPHKMQTVALQFSKALDPMLLCQSLDDTITTRFPTVGSKIIAKDGVRFFQYGSELSRVRLVLVCPESLADPREWHATFLQLQPPIKDESAPLFQAVLLRCADASRGSVLLAGFAHVLGDAASYALLLSAWSDHSRCTDARTLLSEYKPTMADPSDFDNGSPQV
jgi:hypothetical protein